MCYNKMRLKGENIMTYIGEVIEAIKNNGNCQVYYKMTDNPKVNYVRGFRIDDNGDLCVYGRIECYDTPFWDGREFDETATRMICEVLYEQSYDNLCISIAQIVSESIDSNARIGIISNEKEYSKNTTKAVCKLYNIASSMLELKNRQLIKMRLSNKSGVDNILVNNVSEDLKEDLDPRMASILIESKVAQVRARYKEICLLWSDLSSAKSTESGDYVNKLEQWKKYYNDNRTLSVQYNKR